MSLQASDQLCNTCYYHERVRFNKLHSSQSESMEVDDQKIEENEHSTDASQNISENRMKEVSEEDIADKTDDCYCLPGEEQKKNKQILNSILEPLGISSTTYMLVNFFSFTGS